MPLPLLPPAYHLIALDREVAAFQRAVRSAPRGADDGTVYWTDRPDHLEMAIVLDPEAPARRALEAVYVLTVATGDALAPLLPPHVTMAFAWPGDLIVDGAKAGIVHAALAPVAAEAEIPPWLVLGLALDARVCNATAKDCAPARLAGNVGDHLLRWTERWRSQGLGPVRAAWNERCFRRGEVGRLAFDGRHIEGHVTGLTADGDLAIGGHRLQLAEAMAARA